MQGDLRNYRRAHFLTALAVVALLFAVFMQRVTRLSAEAERVAAEQSVVAISTLLTQIVVKHAVRGKLNDLHTFADTNPMRLVETQLGAVPDNYAGEVHGTQLAPAPPGRWYFDVEAAALVYGYISREAQLRLKLKVDFSDSNANGIFDPGTDRVTGLHLQRSMIEGRSFGTT